MKTKYDTIKDLYDAIQKGEIDESMLEITLDNDCISFYLVKDEDYENAIEITVKEASGYSDIEPLYRLLFKKATVQWC